MKVANVRSVRSGFFQKTPAEALSAIIEAFHRRVAVFMAVTVILFAIAAYLILQMPVLYEAVARVQMDWSRAGLAETADLPSGVASETIQTQVSLLKSEGLARSVATSLNLASDPEFAGTGTSGMDPVALAAHELMDRLEVQREDVTYVIKIAFRAEDPTDAARIANAFAEEYINRTIETRTDAARQQSAFLDERLQDKGDALRNSEQQAAVFRAREGITESFAESGSRGTVADQQIGPISSQLAMASSEAAAARAQLQAARRQLNSGAGDSVSAVLSSPAIAELNRQRAEIVVAKGDVQARYGANHPTMRDINQQLDNLDNQIASEQARVIRNLEASAAAAEARVASLATTLRRLENVQARNLQASVEAEALERDAVGQREEFERLSKLAAENDEAMNLTSSHARIVDPAFAPLNPAKPDRFVLLGLALVCSLGAGAAAVAGLEFLSGGVRDPDEFRERFGFPIIAALPVVRGRDVHVSRLVQEQPGSHYAESCRVATRMLAAAGPKHEGNIIAITSTLPHEGKTSVSLSLARTLAQDGFKTIVLDCDLRRGALAGHLSERPKAGLIEMLAGYASPREATIADVVDGLSVIPVLQPTLETLDLLQSGRLERAVDRLKKEYDYVLLDAPPALGISDAQTVCAAADATVLIVKWDSTPTGAIEAAVSTLAYVGAAPVCAIFTMVSRKASAIGGVFYSNKYNDYYS